MVLRCRVISKNRRPWSGVLRGCGDGANWCTKLAHIMPKDVQRVHNGTIVWNSVYICIQDVRKIYTNDWHTRIAQLGPVTAPLVTAPAVKAPPVTALQFNLIHQRALLSIWRTVYKYELILTNPFCKLEDIYILTLWLQILLYPPLATEIVFYIPSPGTEFFQCSLFDTDFFFDTRVFCAGKVYKYTIFKAENQDI